MRTLKKLSFLLLALTLVFSLPTMAQEENTEEDENTETTDEGGITGSAMLGGVTADGRNYQQFAIRTDIPIGKLGFGVDIQLLIDENGNVRKEDWDEWTDYLDKIYYIRWARKNDPFYFKTGGLDYSTMGYGNIINGYSNMIEYPEIKKWGLETSFYTRKLGGELFINNFKELFDKSSMLVGTRLYYKVIGNLKVGATIAMDMNEYAALHDLDNDGYPDAIDAFPDDANLVTEREHLLAQSNDPVFVDMAVKYDLIDGTRLEDLIKYGDSTSMSMAYGGDIGYEIIKTDRISLDVYAAFSQIAGDQLYGWGASLPGVRLGIGSAFTFTAEYRKASENFLFGYYNYTYELERAVFVKNPTTDELEVKTKQQTLLDVTDPTDGYFAGIQLDIAGLIIGGISYSDMISEEAHYRSIKGELQLTSKLLPKDAGAKAYYVQNNVQDFKQWKTPSTIMGYALEYNLNGVALGFDYRYTFKDLDGSGIIDQDDETVKTFGLKTSIKF